MQKSASHSIVLQLWRCCLLCIYKCTNIRSSFHFIDSIRFDSIRWTRLFFFVRIWLQLYVQCTQTMHGRIYLNAIHLNEKENEQTQRESEWWNREKRKINACIVYIVYMRNILAATVKWFLIRKHYTFRFHLGSCAPFFLQLSQILLLIRQSAAIEPRHNNIYLS